MKSRLLHVLFFMMTIALVCSIMVLVVGRVRGCKSVDRRMEYFSQRLLNVWSTSSDDEIYDVTTNAISTIQAFNDAKNRHRAISAYVDALMSLRTEAYKGRQNPLLLRKKVLSKFLRGVLGTSERDILLELDSRIKFYATLKKESDEFPESELPSLVDDIRETLASNSHHVVASDFTQEGMARHKEEIDKTVRAVSKRRKRTYYGRYVREEMRSEENRYYDNVLENRYQVISEKYRTNVLEKVHATIGRYPKWYSPR